MGDFALSSRVDAAGIEGRIGGSAVFGNLEGLHGSWHIKQHIADDYPGKLPMLI